MPGELVALVQGLLGTAEDLVLVFAGVLLMLVLFAAVAGAIRAGASARRWSDRSARDRRDAARRWRGPGDITYGDGREPVDAQVIRHLRGGDPQEW